jgi:hypothetical protein
MNTTPSNLTAPEHWAEWFEKCALVLCCEETRRALGVFAHLRYKQAVNRALAGRKKFLDDLSSEARELIDSAEPGVCWSDLEASCWHGSKLGTVSPENAPADVTGLLIQVY